MPDRFKTVNLADGKESFKEGLVESAGAGDAGKIPALDAGGKLHESVMPAGIGAEVVVAPSSESLTAGQFVNFWNNTGALNVRLADADNERPANGFVKAAVTSPANATVYPLGDINAELSGLTIDTVYFLGKAAGGVTADISAYTNTDIVQRLGKATAAGSILTEQNTPATLSAA